MVVFVSGINLSNGVKFCAKFIPVLLRGITDHDFAPDFYASSPLSNFIVFLYYFFDSGSASSGNVNGLTGWKGQRMRSPESTTV